MVGDGYLLPKGIVNGLIGTIFVSLLSIAGYMVIWAGTDKAWKQHVDTQVDYILGDVVELKERLANHPHGSQILPEAKLRMRIVEIDIKALEKWQTAHEKIHRDNP